MAQYCAAISRVIASSPVSPFPNLQDLNCLAGEHLAATWDNDLLLYDRGYPAFWLFALHDQEQRHFCARMSLDVFREVTAFLAVGKKSDARLE